MTSPKPQPNPGHHTTQGAPPDNSPFVPGPKVAPGAPGPNHGQFNPNIRIDTSTTTSSGTPRGYVKPWVDADGNVHGSGTGEGSDRPDQGDDSHYAMGQQAGRAIGQHISNQIMALLAQMFGQ